MFGEADVWHCKGKAMRAPDFKWTSSGVSACLRPLSRCRMNPFPHGVNPDWAAGLCTMERYFFRAGFVWVTGWKANHPLTCFTALASGFGGKWHSDWTHWFSCRQYYFNLAHWPLYVESSRVRLWQRKAADAYVFKSTLTAIIDLDWRHIWKFECLNITMDHIRGCVNRLFFLFDSFFLAVMEKSESSLLTDYAESHLF